MNRIEIRLGTFAGYASTPIRSRDRKAAEIWQMLQTAYDPATDYWKKPREAIRSYGGVGDVEGLSRLKFESSEPSRFSNYEAAVREFLAWWHAFQPSSARTSKAAVVAIGPMDVIVNPDLIVSTGRLKHVVRIRFNKGTPLLHPERVVTMSLLSEAFPESIPAILDLATGEFTSRAGSDRETLEKVAADLASRWPQV